MYMLRIGHDWASQIESLRNATTEDTNLIRFGNDFYRICHAGSGEFEVTVFPRAAGAPGVRLLIRERDLYVTHIAGVRFETYAQTLDARKPEALALDSALMTVASAVGTKRFELQSIIVFCVAESLRNDHIATRIGQFIRTTTTGIIGVQKTLPLEELLREAHAWGQTSEALFKAMSAEAREIVLKPRAQLTPAQRRFHEIVDLSRLDARTRAFARSIKVLKRPG